MRFFSGKEVQEFRQLDLVLVLHSARIAQGNASNMVLRVEGIRENRKEFLETIELKNFKCDVSGNIRFYCNDPSQPLIIDLRNSIRVSISVYSEEYFDLNLHVITYKNLPGS